MDIIKSSQISPTKVKALSRSSSLLSTLPRLAIPRAPTHPDSSPLSAPSFSASLISSPLSVELPPPPPPSAISPCRHTPILSRIVLPSPPSVLSPLVPTRFLQARSLLTERFTVEYLIARFPSAVRIWASTSPGIVAARIEFESVDVAIKVLSQHGGEEAWKMGSYGLEIEGEGERNRWWECAERRVCMDVRGGELKERYKELAGEILQAQ